MSGNEVSDKERCNQQVIGEGCDRPEGHDGPCWRKENRDERRFGV